MLSYSSLISLDNQKMQRDNTPEPKAPLKITFFLDDQELQRAIGSMRVIRNGETKFPLENYKCDLFVGRSTVDGTYSTKTNLDPAPFIRCLFDHIETNQLVTLEKTS
jgi:hypothetical protein